MRDFAGHIAKICEIVEGDVSAEVIATDYENIIKEGENLAALHPNIVVKVPMIKDGIRAIKYFSSKGIRTNCTLIFSGVKKPLRRITRKLTTDRKRMQVMVKAHG